MALKPCPFCDGPQPLDSCNCTYAVLTRMSGYNAAKKAWARAVPMGRRSNAVASGVAKPAGSSGVEPGGAARKTADAKQNDTDNAGEGGGPKGRPRDREG